MKQLSEVDGEWSVSAVNVIRNATASFNVLIFNIIIFIKQCDDLILKKLFK